MSDIVDVQTLPTGLINRLQNGGMAYCPDGTQTLGDGATAFACYTVLTQSGTVSVSQLTAPEQGQARALRITQSQATAQRIGLAQQIAAVNCQDLRGAILASAHRNRFSLSARTMFALLSWNGTADAAPVDPINDWTSTSYTPGQFFKSSFVVLNYGYLSEEDAGTWRDAPYIPYQAGSDINNLVYVIWTENTVAQTNTLDTGLWQVVPFSEQLAFEHRPYALDELLLDPSGAAVAVLDNIDALQAETWTASAAPSIVQLRTNHISGDGGGTFEFLPADTTSPDNNGTLIVTASGRRYARMLAPATALDVSWFGIVSDSVDGHAAITAAIAALGGNKGVVTFKGGLLTSAQIIIPTQVTVQGCGRSSDINTPGVTYILRGFTGALATVKLSGDDGILSNLDIDNDSQGTGSCWQITGSRCTVSQVSIRWSGGYNFRIGETEAGPSTINANLWRVTQGISFAAAIGDGLIDHTNTDTSGTFPLGIPNVNAGYMSHMDCLGYGDGAGGGHGIVIANAIDNVFVNTVVQSHNAPGKIGIWLKQYARGHKFFGVYTEDNTVQVQLDAGANQNVLIGNGPLSSTATRNWVDNGTANLLITSTLDVPVPQFGTAAALVNVSPGGVPSLDFYADTGADRLTSIRSSLSTGTGGRMWFETKRNGSTPVRRMECDSEGNWYSFAGQSVRRSFSASGPIIDQLGDSTTYDPPNLADGAGVTTTVTVAGAVVGDFAKASFSLDLQGVLVTAYVSSANTVSVRFQNETGAPVDLGSGTLKARVTPQ